MPKVSAWFIRLALIYLALGFTFGGLLLANKGLNFAPLLWTLLPSHIEFLLLGWTLQLAAGVSYWILPRFGTEQPRGNPRLPWAALFLLNGGILLVVLEPLLKFSWMFTTGRLGELSGAVIFVLSVWRRVKPFQK